MLLYKQFVIVMFSGSRVRDQPPVVLPTVRRQVGWVRAVVAHVAQLYPAGGEACPRRLVAGSLIPVIANIEKRQLLETYVRSVEFLLGPRRLGLFRSIFP